MPDEPIKVVVGRAEVTDGSPFGYVVIDPRIVAQIAHIEAKVDVLTRLVEAQALTLVRIAKAVGVEPPNAA